MKPTKSRLVIGYGNREKSDEGAGCRVAEIIQQKDWKDTEALSVQYLTPSLASFMIQAKTVIFVSSYFLFEKMKPEIIVKHFLPDRKRQKIERNHSEPPSSLLSFTESIYHQKPNAFWILIPAVNSQKGSDFSSSTQKAIQNTITYLANQTSIRSLNPMNAIQLLSRKAQGERIFRSVNLHQANLKATYLEEMDLSEADLSNADLSEATLSGSNLSRANLTNADLDRADLRSANLTQVNLIGASLVRAKLGRANLKGADLRGADLSDADLSGTILTDAELSGAVLTGANIGDIELQQAATDCGISHQWITWSGSE
jgi:uncharacterized protein YjbI with pentapeptide repeats